jgi:hypothetical protein
VGAASDCSAGVSVAVVPITPALGPEVVLWPMVWYLCKPITINNQIKVQIMCASKVKQEYTGK